MDLSDHQIEPDKAKRVRGSLLVRMIRMIRRAQWTAGWGLQGEQTENGGIISLNPKVLPQVPDIGYRAKVTDSIATSKDHTVEEIDGEGNIITQEDGGRRSDKAQAYNGRKGVPSDTIVRVDVFDAEPEEGEPLHRFLLPDGLTDNPKELRGTGQTADPTAWDAEEDGCPVVAELHRIDCVEKVYAQFSREIEGDASGFVYTIEGEVKTTLEADDDRESASGWLTILPNVGDTPGGKVLHNAPGSNTRHFQLTFAAGTNVSINGSETGSVVVGFYADQLGHVTLASDVDQTITIAATGGGGSADGKGYEFVDHNSANTGTEPDNGTINFKDNGTTPTLPDVGVAWTLTNNAGTDTVDVEGKVTLPVEDNYPSSVSVDVVTDVRIDPSTFKLQKRVISITALKSAAASGTATGAWVDVHTGEECP